jgi:hypothetical protein
MNGPHVRRGMLLFGMWWIKNGLRDQGSLQRPRHIFGGRVGTRDPGNWRSGLGRLDGAGHGARERDTRVDLMDGWMVNKVILVRPMRWMEAAPFFLGVGKEHTTSSSTAELFYEN